MLFSHAPAKLLFFFLTAKYFGCFMSVSTFRPAYGHAFACRRCICNMPKACPYVLLCGAVSLPRLVEEDEGGPVEGGGVGGADGSNGAAHGPVAVAGGEPLTVELGHEDGGGAVVDAPEAYHQ